MDTYVLEKYWEDAFQQILGVKFSKKILVTLALQTNDSIKRIEIYQLYKERALKAEEQSSSYFHTFVPFVLCQRPSLSSEDKAWFLYLATYFGKSAKSKWELFKRAAFDLDNNLISVSTVLRDREKYYRHLHHIDFFRNATFSNHRKYTVKKLEGYNGFIKSANHFLDNLLMFVPPNDISFDEMYRLSLEIPNFGRMAAFDFTASFCKCDLNVEEPKSMYLINSTGPLAGLGDFLALSGKKIFSKEEKVKLGNNLLNWFLSNSHIYMVAQVLEDAICNWQKSPRKYVRYFG